MSLDFLETLEPIEILAFLGPYKIQFLKKMEMRKIEIMDCTLRDGEQTSGVSFLPHEKLMIARMLLKDVNVDRVEVASARVSEGEKDAVKMI